MENLDVGIIFFEFFLIIGLHWIRIRVHQITRIRAWIQLNLMLKVRLQCLAVFWSNLIQNPPVLWIRIRIQEGKNDPQK